MKRESLIYALGTALVVGGAVMKVVHVPYANAVLLLGFMVITLVQTWHVTRLKKRVKELENKL